MKYSKLINSIGNLLEESKKQAYRKINVILVKTYWEIGKQIINYEQKGKIKAEYGSALLDKLSKDLKFNFGKGFSRRNISDMRRFYVNYPIWRTVSAKLNWSHYIELLNIENALEKSFYKQQCINEKWSVRELSRQINSGLFYRLISNKGKDQIMNLSKKGQLTNNHEDIVKHPYILEFLGLPDKHSENELEQKLIINLQQFLLELGKGFTFVGRQKRISLENTHYYVDLVFYHRILRCFVLIDIKIGKVTHRDIGQMNLYLNYYNKEEKTNKDKETMGIVLCAHKNEIDVEYALGGITNKLFVSKYQLYFPNKKELEKRMKELI